MNESSNEKVKTEEKVRERKIPVFIIAMVVTLLIALGGVYLFKSSGSLTLGGGFNAMMNVNMSDSGGGSTCNVSNCTSCKPGNSKYCITCKSGYKATGGICVAESVNTCASGQIWVPAAGKCCTRIAYCSSYNSSCSCTSCVSGYKVSSGKCTQDTSCASGQIWAPAAGKCCTRRSYCSSYNADCTCKSCVSGYKISSGNCVRDCASGTVYVSSVDKCCSRINNCSNYDSNCKCTSCIAGYHISGGKCLNESGNCGSGQVYVSTIDKCCSKVNYCNSYNSSCACTGCVSGYNLSNGKCVSEAENCEATAGKIYVPAVGKCCTRHAYCSSYNSSCACTECVSGYSLSNGKCVADPANSCSSGQIYVPAAGKCCTKINNCAVYDSNCTCYQCASGYELGSDTRLCNSISVRREHCYYVSTSPNSVDNCIFESPDKMEKENCTGSWGTKPACPYSFKTISCSSAFSVSDMKNNYHTNASYLNGACRNNGYDSYVAASCELKRILGIPIRKGSITCIKNK